MNINSAVKLPIDTVAQVTSDGLLGSNFVALVPGGDDKLIVAGGEIKYTQAPVNVVQLLGKFVFGAVDAASQGSPKKDGRRPNSGCRRRNRDWTLRDLRLDFFRGLALLFIFLDHIPDNYVNYLTLGNLVFSDAAELFVFISGYTAALVFGGVLQRQGIAFATAQVLKRCWTLYVAHIFLFVIYTAQVAYTAAALQEPDVRRRDEHRRLSAGAAYRGLLKALTLRFQPPFLNILPLYIVLLLLLAVMLPLLRRWPLLAAGRPALYLAVPLFEINLPTYPGGQWYFNPFAWQFLFVIGAIMGTAGGLGVEMFRRQRWIFWAAFGVLWCAIAVRVPMTIADLVGDTPAAFSAAVWQFGDKTSLGPLRLFNFLALAYVVIAVAARVPRCSARRVGAADRAVRAAFAQHFLPRHLSFGGRPCGADRGRHGWALQAAGVDRRDRGDHVRGARFLAWSRRRAGGATAARSGG